MNPGKRALRNQHFRRKFHVGNSLAARQRPNDVRDPRRPGMVERREAGLTLEKIGAEFGVSRERARQLIGAQS
jgi:DNA-directed RNA polymerase sigma subunit (sigma70/sigma32)